MIPFTQQNKPGPRNVNRNVLWVNRESNFPMFLFKEYFGAFLWLQCSEFWWSGSIWRDKGSISIWVWDFYIQNGDQMKQTLVIVVCEISPSFSIERKITPSGGNPYNLRRFSTDVPWLSDCIIYLFTCKISNITVIATTVRTIVHLDREFLVQVPTTSTCTLGSA